MTTAFYAPPEQFRGARVMLPPNETRHAVRALRHGPGDEIVVVDGVGGWHRVRLEQTGTDQALGTILTTKHDVGEPPAERVLAVGILHKRSRYETLIEKAVELGITTIVPLATARAERTTVRADRLQKLMVAAMKQCGRSRLPALKAPRSLESTLAAFPEAQAFCCHESGTGRRALSDALHPVADATAVVLAVGPEGGFTDHEVATATDAGAKLVHLGPRRLRAETAAMTAAGALMLHHAA